MSVTVALPSQGQGHATTLAQVAADQFGIDVGRISVRQGDTHLMEHGGGTIASRTAVVVGNAVAGAAAALRQVVLNAAGTALEADPADLRLGHDRIEVAGAPGRSITLRECASRAAAAGEELVGRDSFEPATVTFASGVHAAVVEVDEVTGAVRVLRYVVVHDCGRVINPLIVDGQVAGGVAQGIGAALLEELLYDDAGQLTTASFLDYQIPPRHRPTGHRGPSTSRRCPNATRSACGVSARPAPSGPPPRSPAQWRTPFATSMW